MGLIHLGARSPWSSKARPDLPMRRFLPTGTMKIIVLVIFGTSVTEMYVRLWNADKIVHVSSGRGGYWIRLGDDWTRLGGVLEPAQGIGDKAAVGDVGSGRGGLLDQTHGEVHEAAGMLHWTTGIGGEAAGDIGSGSKDIRKIMGHSGSRCGSHWIRPWGIVDEAAGDIGPGSGDRG